MVLMETIPKVGIEFLVLVQRDGSVSSYSFTDGKTDGNSLGGSTGDYFGIAMAVLVMVNGSVISYISICRFTGANGQGNSNVFPLIKNGGGTSGSWWCWSNLV